MQESAINVDNISDIIPTDSSTAKVKPVPHGVQFGDATLKYILNGVVLEGSD